MLQLLLSSRIVKAGVDIFMVKIWQSPILKALPHLITKYVEEEEMAGPTPGSPFAGTLIQQGVNDE
jgi:hypothetical protein